MALPLGLEAKKGWSASKSGDWCVEATFESAGKVCTGPGSLGCSCKDRFGDNDSFCWMKNSLKVKWSVGAAILEGRGVPSDVDASSEGMGFS